MICVSLNIDKILNYDNLKNKNIIYMKFTKIFCQDIDFINQLAHKTKYDLVLLEIRNQNTECYKWSDESNRIHFYITDDITISCNLL